MYEQTRFSFIMFDYEYILDRITLDIQSKSLILQSYISQLPVRESVFSARIKSCSSTETVLSVLEGLIKNIYT